MLEVSIITTDRTFVENLNSAKIEGVKAEYRPTMAFDSAEHILEIIVQLAPLAPVAVKFAEWVVARKKKKLSDEISIGNQTININNSTEQVKIIINNHIENHVKDKE